MCVLRLWFAIAFLRSLYVAVAADTEEQNSTDSETTSPAPAWHKWPGTRVCPRSTNMLCNRHVLSRTCVCVKIQETKGAFPDCVMPTRETGSFIMAVTVLIPIYPRIEQVFDDLLADIFEQFAGIARRYLLIIRKECLADDKLRVFVAFLRNPAKDTNFTSADLQPMHINIFLTNKFLMAQSVLKVLNVYKVISMHPEVEIEEGFGEGAPANQTVKEPVTLHDIRGSICICGAISTFIIAVVIYKRFQALEDYSTYARRVEPRRKDLEWEEGETVEMLPIDAVEEGDK